MLSGSGRVEIGDDKPTDVGPMDTVTIPAGVRQRIINTGTTDLIFLCICTPRFQFENYVNLEA
jgi:mannose-6-phosphate isomerase-like protein (cupin superfamily)